ncbi:MAG: hypothetical protein K5919_04295 [Clostridiales bacterium]|nr:hypothetical protein [Clostridiales bacterium]
MRAGFGKVEITPPLGVELAGYGYYLHRTADRVLDPLFVRAAAFEQAGERYILVSCDCLGLSRDMVRDAENALKRDRALSPDHLIFVSIHTHTGPAMKYHGGCGETDPAYTSTVADKIAAACRAALDDLAEITELRFFQSAISHPWAYNRACADNPVDDQTRFFRIGRQNAPPMVLASYACHAVCRGNIRAISADYPGRVCANFEEMGCQALYLNGLCGDIDPIRCGKDERPARLAGFAAAICEGLRGEGVSLPPTVRGGQAEARLRLQSLTPEDIRRLADQANEQETDPPGGGRVARAWEREMLESYDAAKTEEAFHVRYLLLGGVPIAALPFEGYTLTGMLIRQALKDPRALVLGCAEEMLGYLPTMDDYDRGSYASRDAFYLYRRIPTLRGEAERLGRDLGEKLAGAMKGEQKS